MKSRRTSSRGDGSPQDGRYRGAVTEHEWSARHVAGPRGSVTRQARAAAVVLVAAAALAGCTTSAPSASAPSPTASSGTATPSAPVVVAPSPNPTETLLPESTSSASSVGALAPGFPVALLPVPSDADILVSAADPIPGSTDLQVSLNLRTSLTPEQILTMYRTSLTAAGFAEAPADQTNAALAAQATFTRSNGDEVLVLGVLDRDGIRTLTLGGRVHAAS